MAYYQKVNCDIRTKLLVELVINNHPDFAEGTILYQSIISNPNFFNLTHLVEDMMAKNSNDQYIFTDEPHQDYSDESECKTGTLHIFDKIGCGQAEISNVKTSAGVLKKGAIRAVVLNPKLKKLHFVFIPKKALRDIMTTRDGEIKTKSSALLTYTIADDSFSKFFKKYGIIEFNTFKELAMEPNY